MLLIKGSFHYSAKYPLMSIASFLISLSALFISFFYSSHQNRNNINRYLKDRDLYIEGIMWQEEYDYLSKIAYVDGLGHSPRDKANNTLSLVITDTSKLNWSSIPELWEQINKLAYGSEEERREHQKLLNCIRYFERFVYSGQFAYEAYHNFDIRYEDYKYYIDFYKAYADNPFFLICVYYCLKYESLNIGFQEDLMNAIKESELYVGFS